MLQETDRSFAVRILKTRAARFLRELSSLKKHIAPESIHDTRVWSRRMRAALRTFQDLFNEGDFQEVYRSVRRVTRALGLPRETEVMIIRLREIEASGDMAEGMCREYLLEQLLRDQRKQQRRMLQRLRDVNPVPLRANISRLLKPLAEKTGVGPEPSSGGLPASGIQPTLFPLESSSLERRSRLLPVLTAPIISFSPRQPLRRVSDERLHRLRIDVKKLRYTMEIFDEAEPGSLTQPAAEARRVQEAAGDHQDWCALCRRLRAETTRLTRQGSNHLAYQAGRLLDLAEQRRQGVRERILPELDTLQSCLKRLQPESAQATPERRSVGRIHGRK